MIYFFKVDLNTRVVFFEMVNEKKCPVYFKCRCKGNAKYLYGVST